MIPYDIDPSLHGSPPAPDPLGDGFSPPQERHHFEAGESLYEPVDPPAGPALGDKSPF